MKLLIVTTYDDLGVPHNTDVVYFEQDVQLFDILIETYTENPHLFSITPTEERRFLTVIDSSNETTEKVLTTLRTIVGQHGGVIIKDEDQTRVGIGVE